MQCQSSTKKGNKCKLLASTKLGENHKFCSRYHQWCGNNISMKREFFLENNYYKGSPEKITENVAENVDYLSSLPLPVLEKIVKGFSLKEIESLCVQNTILYNKLCGNGGNGYFWKKRAEKYLGLNIKGINKLEDYGAKSWREWYYMHGVVYVAHFDDLVDEDEDEDEDEDNAKDLSGGDFIRDKNGNIMSNVKSVAISGKYDDDIYLLDPKDNSYVSKYVDENMSIEYFKYLPDYDISDIVKIIPTRDNESIRQYDGFYAVSKFKVKHIPAEETVKFKGKYGMEDQTNINVNKIELPGDFTNFFTLGFTNFYGEGFGFAYIKDKVLYIIKPGSLSDDPIIARVKNVKWACLMYSTDSEIKILYIKHDNVLHYLFINKFGGYVLEIGKNAKMAVGGKWKTHQDLIFWTNEYEELYQTIINTEKIFSPQILSTYQIDSNVLSVYINEERSNTYLPQIYIITIKKDVERFGYLLMRYYSTNRDEFEIGQPIRVPFEVKELYFGDKLVIRGIY